TVGLAVSVFAMLFCAMSLIKKIKCKQFWEHSLLGGAFLAVYRSIKGSDKTLLKVLAVLIVGAILSATWMLLPVILVLILIFVPKIVKKFMNIKKGIEEVKNGNLTYKIPVEEDVKGVRGELDRMAADINEISKASNIAVQNELKNQRMKTDLISNVSHDLKTPLTSMISYIDLMKKEGLESPNAPEYLDIIDNKTQRLKILTENLFEAAKASSGAIPVNMEEIDLDSLLAQSLVEMEEKLSAKNLDIQMKNECEDTRIMADGQLMWRVLENLFGNISKYAMDNSRVYVNVTQNEPKNESSTKFIILEIKNISKEPLNISAAELMERFKRGDESRNTEGSGLGLAIAKDLVKLMNGVFEITVDGDLFKATVMMEKA
ncbi:MAG: HAMP domain-containing sensor histidine kinase, partial [Anaerovoracaceae bacterium]|nr:HAMP domain-containing sensor histidine kinase [Anaerovoracaceae bacterium]